MRFRGLMLLVLGFASGCMSMLGIEGDYVASSGGHMSGGGSPVHTGGALAEGGTDAGLAGVGGNAGAGGGDAGVADAALPCPQGRKRCTINGTEACVVPDPSIGCSLTGCERCGWPPNGYGLCNGDQCDFACISGYVRHGDACDPITSDASSSTGGGGGTGGMNFCSTGSDCPVCGPLQGCCVPLLSTCGCLYPYGVCLTPFQ